MNQQSYGNGDDNDHHIHLAAFPETVRCIDSRVFGDESYASGILKSMSHANPGLHDLVLDKVLSQVPDPEEREFLKKIAAVAYEANQTAYRAKTVMHPNNGTLYVPDLIIQEIAAGLMKERIEHSFNFLVSDAPHNKHLLEAIDRRLTSRPCKNSEHGIAYLITAIITEASDRAYEQKHDLDK